MKKALFVLIATVCLSLVSCFKESQYSITYHGDPAEVANVTIFEYDSSYDLVATRERRIIVPGKVYEITSSDLAHYLVIGVEATLSPPVPASALPPPSPGPPPPPPPLR